MTDEDYMSLALQQAELAEATGEVPIGALIIAEKKIIVSTHNRTVTDNDPTAHAEIIALREAGKQLGNYRLSGITLYVTLEPCIMCIGAMLHARITHLVFGAYDFRAGACGTCFDFARNKQLNHQIHTVKGGVLAEQSRTVLQQFFRRKRSQSPC